MRVAVVGGGIFGQVVAWRLALRDVDVTLVEAVAAGSWGSGSGDRSRVVRAMYGETRFAQSGAVSLDLFAEWSQELGVPMVERAGVIYLERDEDDGEHARFQPQSGLRPFLGPAPAHGSSSLVPHDDDPHVRFTAAMEHGMSALAALGRRFEVLTPGAAARRWPGLSPSGLRRVVLEPDAGYGRAALTTRAIARAAIRRGVKQRAARVDAIERIAAGFRVTGASSDGAALDLEVDVVVVAAGFAGAALVAPHLAAPIDVRRIPHFTTYWDVPEAGAASLALGALPVWAELGAGLYGFPDDGEAGFKIAWHAPRWGTDGDVSGPPEDTTWLRDAVAARFPALRGATLRDMYRCAYDATVDEGFLVGEVPSASGLWFVGGMSGHGFKHGPAIGESVAAAIVGEAPLVDLSSYALPS